MYDGHGVRGWRARTDDLALFPALHLPYAAGTQHDNADDEKAAEHGAGDDASELATVAVPAATTTSVSTREVLTRPAVVTHLGRHTW